MDGKKPNSGRKYGAQDEYSVEDDIARQASKKQYAREVELQHKEALEQDANAFDYDNVYDEMKGKQAQPIREDRGKREPKYIGKLLEAAKLRAVEHDIAFERNLAKERAKEDHLFPDKEKFVTKKADLGDFYRNLLSRNVAYGATKEIEAKKSGPREEGDKLSKEISSAQVIERTGSDLASPSDRTPRDQQTGREEQSRSRDGIRQIDSDVRRSQVVKSSDSDLEESEERSRKDNTGRLDSVEGSPMQKEVQPPSTIPAVSRKSKEEAVQAARERYLARKKQKVS
ncbi:hypothetical protein R1sor_015608 [Riccia sorocarpa]|uniref:Nuclear speckle splicing regulatory protein 1 N-terminal domain-containing protein n=1 Tax=Riccia sorocarpa TaxID=122646 RepID=A0ABD3HIV1_9MARC